MEKILIQVQITPISKCSIFFKHGFEKISEYTEIERENLGSFYKYLKQI